jgi:basic membrane protein A
MRISPSRAALAIFATAAVAFAACSSPGASTAPSGGKALKVGFVTDVGTLEDKSFNEAGWLGVQDGAKASGGSFANIVTKAPGDYAANIQTFVDQKYDVIVTSGFAMGDATAIAAKKFPQVKFIGTDQGVCVDENGAPDPKFGCKGDASKLLPNYQGLVYKEQQAGYLVGIVAGTLSKTGVIGAVGAINTIPPVVKYLKGYWNGALSVNPNIKVLETYVSTDITKAFNDPATGKSIAQQMIGQKADFIFQVAGLSGSGALEAACAAPGVYGIGVDVDQAPSFPNLKCILTSAEKKLRQSVSAAIARVAAGTDKGGTINFDASTTPVGVGISDFHDLKSMLTPDLQKKVDDALAGMKAGTVDPCKPNACDKP